ncbi:MAG: bifunctional UDP-N-acetylglucosamine diphosphorylase/glucosamine-1-phosphate N-acetyltransferase GlmU [Stappiaceae bacterium]
MTDRSCLAIVLAAGLGTRMRSDLPKVMHPIGGMPLAGHVITAVKKAGADRLALVVGPDMPELEEMAEKLSPDASLFIQKERLGTAHAVRCAEDALVGLPDDVLVLFGDTPLVTPDTISRIRQTLAADVDIAVVGFHAEDPTGYGRLIEKDGVLVAIREHKDATEAERQVTLCNSGIIGFRGSGMGDLLAAIGNDNSKGEFYLTDAVEIGRDKGLKIGVVVADEEEVQGVNNRLQLAQCERVFQRRMRDKAMLDGVTMLAPETVFFCHDTEIESDALIEQNVVFGPNVTVKSRATIRAFSHLEGARVAEGAVVGPYARLRPGSEICGGAKVGNFVEIKKAVVEEGAKVNHLSYIGDARVGRKANIGAGTITCNYDGFDKFFTDIGAGSFVGSNSALVAPVTIGEGAIIGSGSVITGDVPSNALGIGRGRHENKSDWATEFRTKKHNQGNGE